MQKLKPIEKLQQLLLISKQFFKHTLYSRLQHGVLGFWGFGVVEVVGVDGVVGVVGVVEDIGMVGVDEEVGVVEVD